MFGPRPSSNDFIASLANVQKPSSLFAVPFKLETRQVRTLDLVDSDDGSFKLPRLIIRDENGAFEDPILRAVMKQREVEAVGAESDETDQRGDHIVETRAEIPVPQPSVELEPKTIDIWNEAAVESNEKSQPRLVSWDDRRLGHSRPYTSPFATEASVRVREAELSIDSEEPTNAYQHHDIISNLLTIILGIDSVLFAWDKETERYVWRSDLKGKARAGLDNRGRLAGISLENSQRYIEPFLRLATSLVRLGSVQEALIHSKSTPSKTAHAVSSSLSSFIVYARDEISKVKNEEKSAFRLLAFQCRLENLCRLVESVSQTFKRPYAARPPFENFSTSTSYLLGLLHDNLNFHLTYSLLEPFYEQAVAAWLFDHAVKIWWRGWEEWVGIKRKNEAVEDPVKWKDLGIEVVIGDRQVDRNGEDKDEDQVGTRMSYKLHLSRIPTFFPRSVAVELFEAGRALRLLRRAKPGHPLCSSWTVRGTGRGLLWAEGDEAQYLQAVRTRMEELREQIKKWEVGESASSTAEKPPAIPAVPLDNMANFTKYPKELASLFIRFDRVPSAETDSITPRSALANFIEPLISSSNDLKLSILPHSSPALPILVNASLYEPLRMYARLPSTTLLSLFFSDLSLKSHLRVLHSFFLFGNPPFVRRLRESLFGSPEEREGGTLLRRRARDARVWGSKDFGEWGVEREGWGVGIGIRGMTDQGVWPPGGAELSLALRSALEDSIEEKLEAVEKKAEDDRREETRKEVEIWKEVETRLSFAYRHDEIEMDPNSLAAFDFLYLDYKTPAPLDLIITPSVQIKYQQIFTHLLRFMRVEAVLRNLTIDVTKPVIMGLSRNGRVEEPPNSRVKLLLEPMDPRARKTLLALTYELRTLVNGLTSHAYGIAIESNVTTFWETLNKVESILHVQAHSTDEAGNVWNLDSLEALQHQFLDRVMFALLLNKRQKPLLKVLEDGIMGVLMGLARKVKQWRRLQINDETGLWSKSESTRIFLELRTMHESVRSQASTFVKVLQALEDRGSTKSKDAKYKLPEAFEGGFEMKSAELIAALDQNHFYSSMKDV